MPQRFLPSRIRPRARQRGAALMIALILLVVITLVGLAAIGTTIIQNQAASNQYDRQVAFQGAEAALSLAQVAIQNATASAPAPAGFEDCSTTPPSSAPATTCSADPFNDAAAQSHITTLTTTQYNAGPVGAAQPQFIVQYMGRFVAPPSDVRETGIPTTYGGRVSVNPNSFASYYRITARSGNPTLVGSRSVVTLQSTYRN